MARPQRSVVLVLGLLFLAATGALDAQTNSRDAKITNALSAAPSSIGDGATVMDWPARDGAAPAQLRAGTNDWVCFPDMPMTEGNDPMCLDQVWLSWVNAWQGRTKPEIERVGIGYMTAPGGAHGSDTDPFASGPTADNEWGYDPPHIMLLVPDLTSLEGLPTSRDSGGPWVMWSGTPYAHIMAPVSVQER